MREAGDRTSWTDPDAAFEAAVHAAVDAAFDDAGGRERARRRSSHAIAAAGLDQLALGQKLRRSSPCPACPTSTRAASCGTTRWSTRTTGGRSTSTRAAAAGRASTRAAGATRRRRPGAAKLLVTRARAALRRDRPRAVHRATRRCRRRGDGGRRTCVAFDRGGAITRRHPAAGRAGRTRRLGRHGRCPLPAGRGRDVLTGAAVRRRPRRLGDLLADYPVALLAPGGVVSMTDGLEVWAPEPRAGCRLGVDGDGDGRDRAAPRTTAGGHRSAAAARRAERHRLRLPARRRRRRCPTRARDGSRRACTASAGSTTRRVRLDRPGAGPAGSCAGAVIYELHVGTFTPEGTFDAAIERLDHLSSSASTSSSCCRSTPSTAT